MNRRLRLLAGVVTLAAINVSFAETVWASVCTSMASSVAMEEMSMPTAAGGVDCMLMTHGHDAPGSEAPQDHCPLNPVVGAGCSAVAPLPSSSLQTDAPPTPDMPAATWRDLNSGVLLPHVLFRPPRT